MLLVEAADLATRISQTWPRGVNASVWEEVLTELDGGAAGTAYVRLRSSETNAPSIAKFMETYRSIRSTQMPAEPAARCLICDGTGWEPAADHVVTINGEEAQRYSQVAPCPACDAGDKMKRTRVEILRRNGHRIKADA